MATQQNMQGIGSHIQTPTRMGGFASSPLEDRSSGSDDSDSSATSAKCWRGSSDGEEWIEIRGKKTNMIKATKFKLSSFNHVTPNKYKALPTYIKDTPGPHERSPNNNRTLVA